jgi:mannose-6-phosphate isomerase-like protein (cupin superfamily)
MSELHPAPTTPAGLQKVSYRRPALRQARGIARLGGTETLHAVVQVLAEGGRQGLHAHNNYDGVYLAMSGRTRFYGEGGALFAEIGPNEAVIVPRGATYGFEAVGGPAELFYVNAIDPTAAPLFFSREPGADAANYDLFDAEGQPLAVTD